MPDADFVPADFDPSSVEQIETLCGALIDRALDSPDALRRWIADLSALFAAIDEHESRCYIDNACFTEDEEKESAYLHVIQKVQPAYEPLFFELQKKLLASPHREALAGEAGVEILSRNWGADVALFRKENIPLQTQLAELSKDYGKIMGAMLVEFRGETRTAQQMAVFLEDTDRLTREEAWRLVSDRRLQDRQKIESLFEKELTLRQQVAANAGHDDFRSYMWQAKKRFDYTPDDCLAFGRSVEKHCVPFLRELEEKRRDALNLDALRPWDTSVDPKGRPPLRPFDPKDIDGFVENTRRCFEAYSPEFAELFVTLRDHGDLDLASRPGKRPGGFQSSLEQSRRPFIFMNAAGMQGDVETLLHEGGHAFHYLDSRHIENLFVRHAPLEFCEVASMSQELMGADHYGLYYDDPDAAARAKRKQLEGAIRILPWVATIDGFQHWLYTHADHTAGQRTAHWLELLDRFSGGVVDWTGFDAARESMWHRQGHLFSVPFYYIEYGIAQLGALRVWLNHRRDPAKALSQLRTAFALGGTRPLPELFETAGIPFDFGEDTVRELVEAVREELATLPE